MMSVVTPAYTLSSRPGGAFGKNLQHASATPQKGGGGGFVAFPWARSKTSPLSVCQANTYNVPPFALVHPKFPTEPKNNWKITEEADRINLWFKVEEATSNDELEVATNGNVLLIRYKGKPGNNTTSPSSPASSLDVRLLLPSGYENPNTVEAELTFGALLVTVAKPKQEPNPIPIRTS